MVKLYAQLAKDVADGKVGLQQAQSDLAFAAKAVAAVKGIWASPTVAAAVKNAQMAVNVLQLVDAQRAKG